jgi:hypothetical protein
MQTILKKFALGAMVAGAALAVSACGDTSAPVDNSMDVSTTDMSMEGTTNDITSMDAAAGADMNMTDNMMANDVAPMDNMVVDNTVNAM